MCPDIDILARYTHKHFINNVRVLLQHTYWYKKISHSASTCIMTGSNPVRRSMYKSSASSSTIAVTSHRWNRNATTATFVLTERTEQFQCAILLDSNRKMTIYMTAPALIYTYILLYIQVLLNVGSQRLDWTRMHTFVLQNITSQWDKIKKGT